ncbi:MAG: hypothetical protein FWC01_01670 [Treponema sp.]|nr:hypothetical protein [Treponema sp.]MCL2236823.1 hypothetical protein [Treponema sp.]
MNIKPSIILTLIILIFSSQTQVFSQNRAQSATQNAVQFPRLEPDPKALEYYRLGRNGYTWEQLAEIALWASGDTSTSNMERIRTAVANLNSSSDLPSDQKEKADFILSFLHRNILRNYSIYQTRIDTALTNGVYNCVSSAVLYIILCEAAGIRTSGVITREHALVIVHIGGEEIDVETTNRFGFDPGNRREFHDQFGRLTGFAYVPPQNYRDRQTIGKIELVSLIMNNRIADFERRNSFASSVPIAIDRAALLFGESLAATAGETLNSQVLFADPRKDLMDRLINYGATLLRANREDESLRWAAAASLRYPDSIRWQDYTFAAINNRITRLIRDRQPVNAREFLQANRNLLTDASHARLDIVVTDAVLLYRAGQSVTIDEGNAIIRDILIERENGKIQQRRAQELITYVIQRTAASLCASPERNWRAAIRYMETAISEYGANRELEQALATYRGNLAAEYHNRFAAEWNRRNYDEAERILNEGLAEFPDNRQLLSNRETVNRRNN